MQDASRIDPVELRNAKFPGTFRKYDSKAVDQYLSELADRVEAMNRRIAELESSLDERRAVTVLPPPPADAETDDAASSTEAPDEPTPSSVADKPVLATMSDDDIVALVGEETAHVLATARHAAEGIRSKAEEAAARMIREASAESQRVLEEATGSAATTRRDAEADAAAAAERAAAEAARIVAAADADAAKRIEDARALVDADVLRADAIRAEADAEAERIREGARDEGRTMVAEAREVRVRVLEDLQRRRTAAREHIDTLLTARGRLLAAYGDIRADLDRVTTQLTELDPDRPAPDGADDPVDDPDALLAEARDAVVDAVAEEATPAPDDSVSAPDDSASAAEDTASAPVDTVGDADTTDEGVAAVTDIEDPAGHDVASAIEPDEDTAVATEVVEADPAEEPTSAEVAPAPEVTDSNADVDVVSDAVVEVASEPEPAESEVSSEPAPEPEPEPEPESAPEEPSAEADEAATTGDVDALFARIRAEREESVARAQRLLAGDGVADEGAAVPAEATADESSPEPEPESSPEPEPSPEAEAEGEVDGTSGDVDRVPAELLADDDLLAHRANVTGAATKAAARTLKRQLADEQNEVLDALRRLESVDLGALLPDVDAHVARYADAVRPHLASVAVAAARSTGGADVEVAVAVDVGELATRTAAGLVEPFRRRIERSAGQVDGDHEALDERLRSLYREWKVDHLGPIAEDAVLSAYGLGQLTGAPQDARLRWKIDPAQGPCPDAQDNALAGEVAKGEEFPTGDRCPQAHAGCRCVLAIG